MKKHKKYYLVDYENDAKKELKNIKFDPKDELIFFYTENCATLNLDYLNEKKVQLQVVRVEPGKQAVDMCLGTFLGELIKENCEYIIISNDKDFDSVVNNWKKRIKISRRGNSPEKENNKKTNNNKETKNQKIKEKKTDQKNNESKKQKENANGKSKNASNKTSSVSNKNNNKTKLQKKPETAKLEIDNRKDNGAEARKPSPIRVSVAKD